MFFLLLLLLLSLPPLYQLDAIPRIFICYFLSPSSSRYKYLPFPRTRMAKTQKKRRYRFYSHGTMTKRLKQGRFYGRPVPLPRARKPRKINTRSDPAGNCGTSVTGRLEQGRFFGYPECCIKRFCFPRIYRQRNSYWDARRRATNGFVPCALCTSKLYGDLIL